MLNLCLSSNKFFSSFFIARINILIELEEGSTRIGSLKAGWFPFYSNCKIEGRISTISLRIFYVIKWWVDRVVHTQYERSYGVTGYIWEKCLTMWLLHCWLASLTLCSPNIPSKNKLILPISRNSLIKNMHSPIITVFTMTI